MKVSSPSQGALHYLGSMVFRSATPNGTPAFESLAFSDGRIVAKEDGTLEARYHITDHLGSVRTVVRKGNTVVAEHDYYPFGQRISTGSGQTMTTALRHTFSGKEDQEHTPARAPYLDFGARLYSADAGRWLSQDPLAEKYFSLSPYAYCAGNPVNLVDPDGKDLQVIGDADFISMFDLYCQYLDSNSLGWIIEDLRNSPYNFTVLEAASLSKMRFHSDKFNNIIYWNPYYIMETTSGMYISPAVTLFHEMAHASRYDKSIRKGGSSIDNYKQNHINDENNKWGSVEEEQVILEYETYAAHVLNEVPLSFPTRMDHKAKRAIPISASSKPEDISKYCHDNNYLPVVPFQNYIQESSYDKIIINLITRKRNN